MSWQTLEDLRLQQASSLAYFDVFWFFAVVAAALVILVFLMKRSVAEKRGRGRRGITGISPIAIGDLAGFQLALTGTIRKVAAAKPSLPALPVNPSAELPVIRLHEKPRRTHSSDLSGCNVFTPARPRGPVL